MNISGTGLKPQHKAYLIWLVETFGYTINRVSMAEIGVQSGNNKQTVCNYINRLEKCGCITVDKMSAYKWVITISKSKYEDVMNEQLAMYL